MNVSVIIPTYNARALLQANLPSVVAALRAGDELIVVDDASQDDTIKWMQEMYHMRVGECTPNQQTGELPSDLLCYEGKHSDIVVKMLVNATNQRFGESCNRGVRESRHEVVILLNNDVSLQKDILTHLLPHFNVSNVFGVGCKEIATAQGNREYGRNEGQYKRGFFVHRRADDQQGTDTAWVVGGSGAFRKKYWLELGGFDLDFRPAYGEDIDLSFRARNRGWDIRFEPKAIVMHNHESTNKSVFGLKEIEITSYKNACLFMWKTAPFKQKILHLLWLPYHLVFTTIRSHGNFLIGLCRAVRTIAL